MRIIILAIAAIILTGSPNQGECTQPRWRWLTPVPGKVMGHPVEPQPPFPPKTATARYAKTGDMWRCTQCNRNISWAPDTIAMIDVDEHEERLHGIEAARDALWGSHLAPPPRVPNTNGPPPFPPFPPKMPDMSEPFPPFRGNGGSTFQ